MHTGRQLSMYFMTYLAFYWPRMIWYEMIILSYSGKKCVCKVTKKQQKKKTKTKVNLVFQVCLHYQTANQGDGHVISQFTNLLLAESSLKSFSHLSSGSLKGSVSSSDSPDTLSLSRCWAGKRQRKSMASYIARTHL